MARRRRQESSPTAGCVTLVLVTFGIIGGIASCVSGGDASTPPVPDYSTYLPVIPSDGSTVQSGPTDEFDVPSEAPDYGGELPESAIEDAPDTGIVDPGDGGSLDLPGDGYVSGPGVHCGLSGCHGHILPHFGWHF